ncbi:MAG TPA: serine hydrolase [Verrucomicrobiae bacterium]|jgi:CubicO group peptidase (beta-lactamase class C family)|nr:serine hydrolase [Verrucomicrobiae bacterium]
MNWTTGTWLLITAFTFIAPYISCANDYWSGGDLEADIRARVSASGGTEAIVAGVIDVSGTRIIHYGNMNGKDSAPADGDSVFEIGSITKVFTSLILADMVARGEVKLDDPITKYLPANVHMQIKGRAITLEDLATHTSGLPRLPKNFSPRDAQNPYADYTVENLYDFLRSYTPTNEPGANFEYSNLGVGLLGHLLALRAGTNYEALVIERVCHPLGMTHTMITLTPEMRARLATGHDENGKAVANWDLPTLAGAGALRSTVNDMLKLASAGLGSGKTDLNAALELTEKTRHAADSSAVKVGLGWMTMTVRGDDLFFHNGGTGGYRSFLGFDKHNGRAIVILASSAKDVDAFGMNFLRAQSPADAAKPAPTHVEIKLNSKTLTNYSGRYQFSPEIFFSVRVANGHLEGQMTGQGYLPLFAESDTEFFNDSVAATITFNRGADGKATSLVLHQGGLDQTAKRAGDAIAEKKHVAIAMEPKAFDAFVGEYSFRPGLTLTAKRDGEHFYVMLTGQSFLEIFPESETNFFLKVVDAQLTFVKGEDGKVSAVILHQNGADQRATRM